MKKLVLNPLTISGNSEYNRIDALFFCKDEPTEAYLNFEGNEADSFEENIGKEYLIEQLISPSDIGHFVVKATGKQYPIKAIDFDTKSVVSTSNKWFGFEDVCLRLVWGG